MMFSLESSNVFSNQPDASVDDLGEQISNLAIKDDIDDKSDYDINTDLMEFQSTSRTSSSTSSTSSTSTSTSSTSSASTSVEFTPKVKDRCLSNIDLEKLPKQVYFYKSGHNSSQDKIYIQTCSLLSNYRVMQIKRNKTNRNCYEIICHPELQQNLQNMQKNLSSNTCTSDNINNYRSPIMFIPTVYERFYKANLWDGKGIKRSKQPLETFDHIKNCIQFIVLSEKDYHLLHQSEAPMSTSTDRNIKNLNDNQFILVHNEHSIILIRECIKKFAEVLKKHLNVEFDFYMDVDDDLKEIHRRINSQQNDVSPSDKLEPEDVESKSQSIGANGENGENGDTDGGIVSDVDGFINYLVVKMKENPLNKFIIVSLRAERMWRKKGNKLGSNVTQSIKCEKFRIIRMGKRLYKTSHITSELLKPIEYGYESKRFKYNNIFDIPSESWENHLKLGKLRKQFQKLLFQGEDFGICKNLLIFENDFKLSKKSERLVSGIKTQSAYLDDFVIKDHTPVSQKSQVGTEKIEQSNANSNSDSVTTQAVKS